MALNTHNKEVAQSMPSVSTLRNQKKKPNQTEVSRRKEITNIKQTLMKQQKEQEQRQIHETKSQRLSALFGSSHLTTPICDHMLSPFPLGHATEVLFQMALRSGSHALQNLSFQPQGPPCTAVPLSCCSSPNTQVPRGEMAEGLKTDLGSVISCQAPVGKRHSRSTN